MSRPARLLAFMLPALAVLIALGTWQLQRLDWKQGLIAEMDARVDADPVALPAEPPPLEEWRFRPVSVEGAFEAGRDFLFPARTLDGRSGLDVLTPFRRADTGETILVHRGWAPTPEEVAPPPQGQRTVTAVLRHPWEKTLFRPDNQPETNQWFWMDLGQMAAELGETGLAPYYLALVPGGESAGYPVPRPARPDLVNNHLSYALTWYALALVLAAIGTILIRAELRQKPESDHAR